MIRLKSHRASAVSGLLGVIGLLVALMTSPAHAHAPSQSNGTCPAPVERVYVGWVCSMLMLHVPDEPVDAEEVERWSGVVQGYGYQAAADGIVFSDAAVDHKVTTLYQTQLDREPDPGAVEFWRTQVQQRRSELVAEIAIFGSDEYLSSVGGIDGFVEAQYAYYLGRDASSAEVSAWADRHASGEITTAQLAAAIGTSPEAGSVRANLLYERYAHRSPDPAGAAHWSQQADTAGFYRTVVSFAASSEVVTTLGAAAGANLPASPG